MHLGCTVRLTMICWLYIYDYRECGWCRSRTGLVLYDVNFNSNLASRLGIEINAARSQFNIKLTQKKRHYGVIYTVVPESIGFGLIRMCPLYRPSNRRHVL